MGSHHGAVCAPSRAMLLSGKPYMNIPKAFIDQGLAPADTSFFFCHLSRMVARAGLHYLFYGQMAQQYLQTPQRFLRWQESVHRRYALAKRWRTQATKIMEF